MSDTYTGVCKVCKEETDLIEGICANCFEEKIDKQLKKITPEARKTVEEFQMKKENKIIECPNCKGTYFVEGTPCPRCNKGTLPPKEPLCKKIKDFFKATWYWWGWR